MPIVPMLRDIDPPADPQALMALHVIEVDARGELRRAGPAGIDPFHALARRGGARRTFLTDGQATAAPSVPSAAMNQSQISLPVTKIVSSRATSRSNIFSKK